jgi:hypothetical protein
MLQIKGYCMLPKNSYTNYNLYNYRLVSEKYKNTELFTNCIEISCPSGYIEIINNISVLIKKYNKLYKQKVKFSQVKMKFGNLTIYFENGPMEYTSKQYREYKKLLEKINILILESKNLCKICGKQMVDIVINSKILKKCFEHYNAHVPSLTEY